jgi:hypothetical protein
MATTTNYGWTTPDDTALVKDGASAIRTLGSSVDTTTKNLNPETTLADLAYRSSTANVNTRLGIGTTGQVLTVAGGVPSWATPASGGMTLISTTTLNAATITLSSIPQSYTNLLINISGVTSSGGSSMRMKINSDTTNTSVVFVAGDGGAGDQISTFMTDTYFPFTSRAMDASNANNVSTIIFNQYASTTAHKSTNFNAQFIASNSTRYCYVGAGSFASTSAISSLEFYMTNSASFSTGTVLLYGVK